jgi:anti-sigma regulatory factor (Ser/Thr protein kinase)
VAGPLSHTRPRLRSDSAATLILAAINAVGANCNRITQGLPRVYDSTERVYAFPLRVYDSQVAARSTRSRILDLFASDRARPASDVAAAMHISRQAAHRHLAALVESGALRAEGRGRAVRYRAAGSLPVIRRYPRGVIAEDRVWQELSSTHSAIRSLAPAARAVFQYGFTEMLNNAIEHSASKEVEVRFEAIPRGLAFEIIDEGRGVFTNLRKTLHLRSDLEALQELSKGKLTTLPEGHTGEGIFFTSKVADQFELESGSLRWQVDNVRGDVAVGQVASRHGTRVRFEARTKPRRKLADVFAEYTRDFEFQKTRVVVKLFTLGTRFISRSEARRVLNGLERFREAVLDFHKVEEVGQGFADEVFRVWPASHRDTKLSPVNMNNAVAFMMDRGRAGQPRAHRR